MTMQFLQRKVDDNVVVYNHKQWQYFHKDSSRLSGNILNRSIAATALCSAGCQHVAKLEISALGWEVLDQHFQCLLSSCQWWGSHVDIPAARAQMAAVIGHTAAVQPTLRLQTSGFQRSRDSDWWVSRRDRTAAAPPISWSRAKDDRGMVKSWQLIGANDVTLGSGVSGGQ